MTSTWKLAPFFALKVKILISGETQFIKSLLNNEKVFLKFSETVFEHQEIYSHKFSAQIELLLHLNRHLSQKITWKNVKKYRRLVNRSDKNSGKWERGNFFLQLLV